jgi:hypothetical protein
VSPRFRWTFRVGALVSVFLSAAMPRSASAQPSSDADALIEKGIQLREKGHDDQALVEFRHAYALAPSPRARAQMGLAEQAVGSWVLAEQHLSEALAATADPWISSRRAVLTTAAAAIAHHLGTLVVTGPPQPNARVLLDGVDVGALPLAHPMRLETGSRLLEVRAPGFYPVVRTLDIQGGATARENVSLVAAPNGETGAKPQAPAAVPAEEKISEGGAPGPRAFHGTFLPGGPATGGWTLRDESDAVLCKLPCAYWLDNSKKYAVVRSSMMQGGSEIRLTPLTTFTEGAYAEEQIRQPTGSRIGGIVLLAGGVALATVGVVVYATAPTSTPTTLASTSGYYQDEIGVIAMIAGGFATAGGVAMIALSDPWRVDARLSARPAASLHLTERGLELSAGTARAWLSPFGARGSF